MYGIAYHIWHCEYLNIIEILVPTFYEDLGGKIALYHSLENDEVI